MWKQKLVIYLIISLIWTDLTVYKVKCNRTGGVPVKLTEEEILDSDYEDNLQSVFEAPKSLTNNTSVNETTGNIVSSNDPTTGLPDTSTDEPDITEGIQFSNHSSNSSSNTTDVNEMKNLVVEHNTELEKKIILVDYFQKRRGIPRKMWNVMTSTKVTPTISTTAESHFDIENVTRIRKDNLRDSDKALMRAAHGIHLYDSGIMFIFPDTFDQFISVKIIPDSVGKLNTMAEDWCKNFTEMAFPTELRKKQYKNYRTKIFDGWPLEEEYQRDAPDDTWANNDNDFWQYQEMEDACLKYSKIYKELIETMNKIITESEAKFKEENINRKKRAFSHALAFGTGLVVGTVIGTFVGYKWGYGDGEKHAYEQVDKKLKDLSARIGDNYEKVQVLQKEMIGLTKTIEEHAKENDRKLKLLAEVTNKQFKIVSGYLSGLGNATRLLFLRTELSRFVTLNLFKIQNILLLELDRIKNLENILLRLNKGELPKSLINKKKLMDILDYVQLKIGGRYDLAIPLEEWEYYYNFPLVTYALHEEWRGVFIDLRLKIPIIQKSRPSKFQLIIPHFTPFPCPTEDCFGQATTKGKMMSFADPHKSWLYNTHTYEVDFEANLDHASCKDTGGRRICFTFQTNLLSPTSKCVKAIQNYEETEMSVWCKFRLNHRSEYRAIQMSQFKYVIHPQMIDKYYELCPKSSDWIEFKTNKNKFAQILQLVPNCDVLIPKTRQKLMAPFSEILGLNITYQKISFHSALINKLAQRFQKEYELLPIPEFLIGNDTELFNETQWRILDEELNNNQMIKLTKDLAQMTNRLNIAMNKMSPRVETLSFHASFWAYFSLLGKLIQVTISLCIVFKYLTTTNLLGMVTTTLLVMKPDNAIAFELFGDVQIIGDVKLFPELTFSVLESSLAMSYFIDVGFLVATLIILLSTLICSPFRLCPKISHHYGSYRFNSQRSLWSLMVTMYCEEEKLFGNKIEVANIRINLPEYSIEGLKSVELKTLFNVWFMEAKSGTLSLTEQVHVYAIGHDNKRIMNMSIDVSFNVNTITWTSEPKPTAMLSRSIYGLAMLQIVRNANTLNNASHIETML